jgi:two-component system, NarL family, sensor histidine kinase UhpB
MSFLDEASDLTSMIQLLTLYLKNEWGFDAVGIRVRAGNNYPYFETKGLSDEFIRNDSRLCTFGEDGAIVGGNMAKEGLCGLVITGRYENEPCFTSYGSFWTNNYPQYVAKMHQSNPGVFPKTTPCCKQGYHSLGLIPLRAQNTIYGLLQLNDRRTNRFNDDFVTLLEWLARGTALVVARFKDKEELLERENELKEKLLFFRTLIDTVPSPIFYKDNEGRLLGCNDAFEKYSGVEKEQIIGKTAKELGEAGFFPRLSDALVQHQIDKSLAEGQSEKMFVQEIERYDGVIRHMIGRKAAYHRQDGHVAGIVGVLSDVTELKQVERALKESEERFRVLFEDAPLGYQSLNEAGEITNVNNAWLRATGYERQDVYGVWFGSFLAPSSASLFKENFTRYKSILEMRGEEFEMMRRNGETFIASFEGTAAFDSYGNFKQLHCIFNDITEKKSAEKELKRSQEALRNLSRRLESVREEERARISRDIHDEVGQMLTVLQMEVTLLRRKLPVSEKALIADMEDIRSQITNTLDMVRRISADSRPHILDDLGLESAVEWQRSQFERRTGIRCRLEFALKDLKIDHERSTILFRILQEALTNVLRHSGASAMQIYLGRKDNDVVLTVKDNGKGIADEKLIDPASSGIVGMKERVYPWHGTVLIEGKKNKGTTVTVTLPLSEESENND